jgi:site-specific DNA-cytosine methylase
LVVLLWLLASHEDLDSDAEVVCKKLRERGYFTMYKIFEARDHGSLAARSRCYFFACSPGRPDGETFFSQCLLSTAIGPGDHADFLYMDPEDLADANSKVPVLADPEQSLNPKGYSQL